MKGKTTMLTAYNFHSESITLPIGDISIGMPDGYWIFLTIASIVLGIVAFALALFAAIFIKRARPLGVIVAIAQPVGFIAAALSFIFYTETDFSGLGITFYGSTTGDAILNVFEHLWMYLVDDTLGQFLGYAIAVIVYQAVALLTLIYFISLFKAPKGKGLAVFAFIVALLRFVFMGPVEIITLAFDLKYFEIQAVWNILFNLALLLPLFFVALQAIINAVHNAKVKKSVKLAAAEAAEAAGEEFAPAVEEAVEEAVAAEEVQAEEAVVTEQTVEAPVEEAQAEEAQAAATEEVAAFCPQCGCARQEGMNFCPECGHKF